MEVNWLVLNHHSLRPQYTFISWVCAKSPNRAPLAPPFEFAGSMVACRACRRSHCRHRYQAQRCCCACTVDLSHDIYQRIPMQTERPGALKYYLSRRNRLKYDSWSS